MAYLYVACLLPVALGMILWLRSREVNWIEWVGGSAAAFLVAGITHYFAFQAQTGDTEVWNGQIVRVRQFSEWQEYYEEAVYKTVYSGTGKNRTSRRVFSHWSPRRRWHSAHWTAYSNINTTHSIDSSEFQRLCKLFNSHYAIRGDRSTMEHASRMIGGDPNDYIGDNTTAVVVPIHVAKAFTNRIKAAPSVFSFVKVDKNTPVFEYPPVSNEWVSNRLMGAARTTVNTHKWDQLNAVLGPMYELNLLLVGFTSSDSMLGEWQKAKWCGGKKNDLVLCYGPGWAKVFGWSQSDACKHALESVLLAGPIDDTLLPKITQTLAEERYKRRDWHDFDYIDVEPTGNQWFIFLFCLFGTQAGLYFWFHSNDHCKEATGEIARSRRPRYY